MNHLITFSAFIVLFIINSVPIKAQWTIDLETGIAFQSYNQIRIPNEQGTAFDFTKDFDIQGPVIPFRARIAYSLNGKNHFIALYAPLGISYEGVAPFNINFQNSSFEQGSQIEGFYQFNSYRFTYRRDFIRNKNWIIGAGLTAKIRDARVSLTNDEGARDWKNDLGFVPLVHVFTEYRFDKFSIYFEGDGLAGGPGRAFDLFLGGRVSLSQFVSAKFGYRMLEGGANIDEVYNFTLVNFATVGLIIHL